MNIDLLAERKEGKPTKYSVRIDGIWLQIDGVTYSKVQDQQSVIEEAELTIRSLIAESAQKQVPF